MEVIFWEKDIPGKRIEIRSKDEMIGSIEWQNHFSGSAQAMINGKLFELNREFFMSRTEILDCNDRAMLGSIMVNLINPRSDIVLNGKRFEIEVKNLWQSKWAWKYKGREVISYSNSDFILKTKGSIELQTVMSEEVEILILLGLYVRNQFVWYMLLGVLALLLVLISP